MKHVKTPEVPLTHPVPCSPEAWKKHGIAIQPSESWEAGYVQNIFSTAEPLDNGQWRLWYGVNQPNEAFKTVVVAEGIPGENMVKHRAVISRGDPEDAPLAIGGMPQGCEPVQPVHVRLKDGRHRIYFWAHNIPDGFQRFLSADSDDGRRYRTNNPDKPHMISFWDRSANQFPADMRSNDGATVYRMPDGSLELYVQTLIPFEERTWPSYAAHDNIPGKRRMIDRLTSEDGVVFSDRKRIIEPDELDPPDLQFYYFTVTHTDRGYVGMLGRYPVQSQYMDLEWCFSTDGIKWQRPYRTEWIRRGKPFEPDCYTIYPTNAIVHSSGKWWFFYTGVNYAHNLKHSYGPPKSCIMYATTKSLWDDASG